MITTREVKKSISTSRRVRPFNIATSTIAFAKTDRQCMNMLFHKSVLGHILIALNKYNQPVNAWRDIDGIVPIRSAVVASSRFRELLLQYKPKCLYLNDGSLLKPLPFQPIISMNTNTNNKSLNILNDNQTLKLHKNPSIIDKLSSSSPLSTTQMFDSQKITSSNNNNTIIKTSNMKSKSKIPESTIDNDYILKLHLYTNRALHDILKDVQNIDNFDGSCISTAKNPTTTKDVSELKKATNCNRVNFNIKVDINAGHRLNGVFGKNPIDLGVKSEKLNINNCGVANGGRDCDSNDNVAAGYDVDANDKNKHYNVSISNLQYLEPTKPLKKCKSKKKKNTMNSSSSSSSSSSSIDDNTPYIINNTHQLPNNSINTQKKKKNKLTHKHANVEKVKNNTLELITSNNNNNNNKKTMKNHNNNNNSIIPSTNTIENPPTFNDMQIMDPTINQKEYKQFCKEFKRQQLINMKIKKIF